MGIKLSFTTSEKFELPAIMINGVELLSVSKSDKGVDYRFESKANENQSEKIIEALSDAIDNSNVELISAYGGLYTGCARYAEIVSKRWHDGKKYLIYMREC
jgi:Zn/Cd-binding protein ZinT